MGTMKLRIRGNSIRLRVTKRELARLDTGDAVEERTPFPGGSELRYTLVCLPKTTQEQVGLHADFTEGILTVGIPQAQISTWAGSEQVGLQHSQNLPGGDTLKILIEKDFQCLAPREGEEDVDTFPHPDTANGGC